MSNGSKIVLFNDNDKVGVISHSGIDPYLYLELKNPKTPNLKFRGNLSNPILFKDNADPLAFLTSPILGMTMFTALDIDKCEIVNILFIIRGKDECEVYVLNMEDVFNSEAVDCVNVLTVRFKFNKIERIVPPAATINDSCEETTYLLMNTKDKIVAVVVISGNDLYVSANEIFEHVTYGIHHFYLDGCDKLLSSDQLESGYTFMLNGNFQDDDIRLRIGLNEDKENTKEKFSIIITGIKHAKILNKAFDRIIEVF